MKTCRKIWNSTAENVTYKDSLAIIDNISLQLTSYCKKRESMKVRYLTLPNGWHSSCQQYCHYYYCILCISACSTLWYPNWILEYDVYLVFYVKILENRCVRSLERNSNTIATIWCIITVTNPWGQSCTSCNECVTNQTVMYTKKPLCLKAVTLLRY